jgi:hypothetical protein
MLMNGVTEPSGINCVVPPKEMTILLLLWHHFNRSRMFFTTSRLFVAHSSWIQYYCIRECSLVIVIGLGWGRGQQGKEDFWGRTSGRPWPKTGRKSGRRRRRRRRCRWWRWTTTTKTTTTWLMRQLNKSYSRIFNTGKRLFQKRKSVEDQIIWCVMLECVIFRFLRHKRK